MESTLCTELLVNLKSFRTSGKFTDMTIVCGKDVYSVHKVLVCALSPVFLKAITFPVREAKENKIDLSKKEPALVKLLVQYLYEADYEPTWPATTAAVAAAILAGDVAGVQSAPHNCKSPNGGGICNVRRPTVIFKVCNHHQCGRDCNYSCSNFICELCLGNEGHAKQLLIHAKLYQIADIYEITGLKKLCIEKFRRACVQYWDVPEFAGAIKHVFESTPEHDKGLRDIVCRTISQHMSLLDKPEIRVSMTECNALVFGVLLLEKAKR